MDPRKIIGIDWEHTMSPEEAEEHANAVYDGYEARQQRLAEEAFQDIMTARNEISDSLLLSIMRASKASGYSFETYCEQVAEPFFNEQIPKECNRMPVAIEGKSL